MDDFILSLNSDMFKGIFVQKATAELVCHILFCDALMRTHQSKITAGIFDLKPAADLLIETAYQRLNQRLGGPSPSI